MSANDAAPSGAEGARCEARAMLCLGAWMLWAPWATGSEVEAMFGDVEGAACAPFCSSPTPRGGPTPAPPPLSWTQRRIGPHRARPKPSRRADRFYPSTMPRPPRERPLARTVLVTPSTSRLDSARALEGHPHLRRRSEEEQPPCHPSTRFFARVLAPRAWHRRLFAWRCQREPARAERHT